MSSPAGIVLIAALIGELDVDVIVPSMARGPAYQETNRADIRRRITAIAERLERGETS